MRPDIRGIVICVDFDDLLEVTLGRNMRHLTECLVVTAPHDERTRDVCKHIPCVRVHTTDAFYRHGAKFNKGLAMEEGFDALGRHGWILVWDADILLPDRLNLPPLTPGTLYGASRCYIEDPRAWTPFLDWSTCRRQPEHVPCPGFFQLFHATDHHVAQLPWYDVTFSHAGGGDGYFQSRWGVAEVQRLDCMCLHLGPRDTNWMGRVTPRRDGQDDPNRRATSTAEMNKLLAYKGWRGQPRSVTKYEEHVQVPGHPMTGFTT